ncbi:uncharacterized protein LOC143078916 isoform X2 [Mytilus galloprovincialis]|uniref:uncharacterized protein LOC143078916 isoform X2 n=1 Tax=Mytilus galloprovincialis TaxID=29158 RepID=UPI003F7CD1DE
MIYLVYLVIGFTSYIFQVSAHQPQIAVSPEVIVGKTVDLTCSYPVELNKTTTFKWYVNDTRSSATTQQHILQFNVTKTDKYNVYKCEVEVTTAGSNERPLFDKTIKLQPKYPPTIHMQPSYVCNRLQNITLSCEADGSPAKYKFSDWEHRVGGTVIRHLPGDIVGNISYLRLSLCTYQDTGTYYCTVGNNVTHPNNTKTSVASVDFKVKGLSTDEPLLCSFMSLGFQLQVVIIVVTGVVVCVVVLAVAMIVIRRCGSSDSSRDKIKETQKERRLTRVRSVLEDGTVVYDEVDDSKWTQAKKERKEKKAKKKKIVNCHVPEAYEDVGVKNPGQSYEMLHKHNSKSKPFFRKKSSKVAKRMEILTTSGSKGTHENLYSTNSSNPDHYDNTEITSDVKTSLSKDEIPLPKRGYRNESIIVYDDATSNSKLNTSCKAMVHEPSEYITMKPKCLEETSFKNKESSSMKDNEYTSMKNKELASKQSNESREKDDNDTDEVLYVNLKLA